MAPGEEGCRSQSRGGGASLAELRRYISLCGTSPNVNSPNRTGFWSSQKGPLAPRCWSLPVLAVAWKQTGRGSLRGTGLSRWRCWLCQGSSAPPGASWPHLDRSRAGLRSLEMAARPRLNTSALNEPRRPQRLGPGPCGVFSRKRWRVASIIVSTHAVQGAVEDRDEDQGKKASVPFSAVN